MRLPTSSEVPAILVRGVSKAYRLYANPEDRLKQMLWRRRQFHKEFWAVRDISFDVARGETVGVVGCNGAGKSTLLSVICGLLTPTAGTVSVNGRIAPLLGLGGAFNPDFTGRENLVLQASILGLNEQAIAQCSQAIVDFADIGSFIDQPVKTYSSGMFVRLAFAVAINVDPDILVVDEALSVGDAAFQRKCHARFEQIKENGATILFVSHSARNVVDLCDRAILLDQGELLLDGDPKGVISQYLRLMAAGPDDRDAVRRELAAGAATAPREQIEAGTRLGPADADLDRAPAETVEDAPRFDPELRAHSTVEFIPQGANILDVHIRCPARGKVNVLVPEADYDLVCRVAFDRDVHHVSFGLAIKAVNGVGVAGLGYGNLRETRISAQAGQSLDVIFPFKAILSPGTYFASITVRDLDRHNTLIHRIADAYMFRIVDIRLPYAVSGFVDVSQGRSVQVRDPAPSADAHRG